MSHRYHVLMHLPSEDLYLTECEEGGEGGEIVAAMQITVQDAWQFFDESALLLRDFAQVARSRAGEQTTEWARQEPESAWSDALGLEDIARMAE